MAKRGNYTLDEMISMKKLLSEGKNYAEVGRITKRSSQAIAKLIKRAGGLQKFIPIKHFEFTQKSRFEANKKRSVSNLINLTEEEFHLIDKMIKEGSTISQIHKHVNYGYTAFLKWMRKHRREYFYNRLGDVMNERVTSLEMQIKILSKQIKELKDEKGNERL